MAAFALLFVPALTATLGHGVAWPVISAFLARFRVAVGVCVLVLLAASAAKYLLWETLTGWLLARWAVLAAMTGLAAYDFQVLAPRLAAARAAGDAGAFDRLHVTAARTMGATLVLGLAALGLS
jgi:hypothetical protein